MARIALVGGEVITPLKNRFTSIWIEGETISGLSDDGSASRDAFEKLDVSGCYVTPGLIDLQVNGAAECDFWGDPTDADVQAICGRMLKSGVTCFLPTLITDDLGHMSKNISFLSSLGVGKDQRPVHGVRLPGLHLEGPCLSPQRPGVHPPEHLQPLTTAVLEKITSGPIKLVTAAPELDKENKAIKYLQDKGIAVALGHSNATFEEAGRSFNAGVKLVTHTYNALPPLHHRAPGAVGAAMLDDSVTCCVICDGLHVDPEAVRLLVRMKGCEHIVLVTDVAHVGTTAGGLVGSSIFLDDAVRNIVNWGVVSFSQAILMASWNAAKAIGIESTVGLLDAGRLADLVVWNREDLAIKYVIVNGEIVVRP